MKCKVLSSTIVYANEYFKPGAIFDAKDEDVEGLVEGGFVEAIEASKEVEVTEEPAESKEPETVEETPKEEPKAEEKLAEKPKAKGGKKK